MSNEFYKYIKSKVMRLGQFFSNIGNKVKNFGLKVGSTVSKIAPKIIKGGRFVSGILQNVPGIIGTAAGWINKGLNAANQFIDALPESNFKNKLQNLSGKANDIVDNTVNKVTPYADKAKLIGDTASKVIDKIEPHII